MAYSLKSVTVRADNSENGMKKIAELWNDITSGKIPLIFDSDENFCAGLSPISVYDNYANAEKGEYDLTVTVVTSEFFAVMDGKVKNGEYIKIEKAGDSISDCANAAWAEVWSMTESGKIFRAFKDDYESTVPPEYTKDGKAHCYLYISVKRV
ncbi:MAG: AraC family transcriptional regulator [Clostridiales bacterium]|nr:AraC family transcriptional regulator [Clostridiales bacterium]